MLPPDPRRISAQYLQHLVDYLLALWSVLYVPHPVKQAVVLRVIVVRGVLAPLCYLALGAVQQEQEILWIWVVRVPPKVEHLRVTLTYLVLEAVVVCAACHQLHVDLVELLAQPV